VSPRCAALSERLSPQGRRALAAFIDGRLPAGQLHDELLRARDAADQSAASMPSPGASRELSLPAA
jgi:hypothetical protein